MTGERIADDVTNEVGAQESSAARFGSLVTQAVLDSLPILDRTYVGPGEEGGIKRVADVTRDDQ